MSGYGAHGPAGMSRAAPASQHPPGAAEAGKGKLPADKLHAQDAKKMHAAEAKKMPPDVERQRRDKGKDRRGRDGEGGDRDRDVLAAPYRPATYEEIKDDGVAALLQRREASMIRLSAFERREMRARKGPPPVLPRTKGHWDYVLDEMQWMAIDFRQVRVLARLDGPFPD